MAVPNNDAARAALADELLPCPFCGCEAKLETGRHNFEDAQISCVSCAMSGPVFDNDILIGGVGVVPIPDAIKHWNTRAALPAAGKVREALKPFADMARVWCDRFGATGEITTSVDLAHLDAARRALALPQSKAGETIFRCNCPHEVRSGCSEPKCPHYAGRSANAPPEIRNAALPASPAPQGEEAVVVPSEPTEEMAIAGRKALAVVADRMETAKLLATSSIDFWQQVGHEPANEIYKAMLAAAPPTAGRWVRLPQN